jgi:hypothetical protein
MPRRKQPEAPRKLPKMSRLAAAALPNPPKDFRSPAQLKVELETGRPLTQRQKKFAEYFVEGIYSHAQCARMAGYTNGTAKVAASNLLNPTKAPHVCEYIAELQEERERRYGVTLNGQLKRLSELSQGAEKAGQYSAAINAEKLRSALGGLTIDRRETINRIDQMTKDEILGRLTELQRKFPQAFQVVEGQYDVVLDAKALTAKAQ